MDQRRQKLKKGLEQLNNDQLEKVLAAKEMVLDEYYYKAGKF